MADTDADLSSCSMNALPPPTPPPPPAPLDCKLAAVRGDSCLTERCQQPFSSEDDSALPLLYPDGHLTVTSEHPTCQLPATVVRSTPRCKLSDALWRFSSQQQTSTTPTLTSRNLTDDENTEAIQNEQVDMKDKDFVEAHEDVTKDIQHDAILHQEELKIPPKVAAESTTFESNAVELPELQGDHGATADLPAITYQDLSPIYAVLSLLPPPETTFLSSHSTVSGAASAHQPENPAADRVDAFPAGQVSPVTSCAQTDDTHDTLSLPASPKSAVKDVKILPPPVTTPSIVAKLPQGPNTAARQQRAAQALSTSCIRKPMPDCSILPVGRRLPLPTARSLPPLPSPPEEQQESQFQSTLSTSAVVPVIANASSSSHTANKWATPPTLAATSDSSDGEDDATLADPATSVESISAEAAGPDDCPREGSETDCEGSGSSKRHTVVRWGADQDVMARQLDCADFEMTSNCYDANNSGQGVDMQNLPSIAEQLERQRTWMTIYFRFRVNWYEARAVLGKMPRDVAYRTSNLPLWTRCVKVQLHRKTIFLNAIRAFRNRMQCALSGVRFTLNAFYQEDRRKGEVRDGPESKPLPYFRCPDDMPDLKTMVVAQLNVFVSNSTSYFDQFWDESLKEHS